MSKIAVSGESTMDLSKDDALKMGIHLLPFHVEMGEESYLDGEDGCRPSDIIAFFEKTGTLARTSACNVEELKEHFAALLKDYDEIVHFTISSALSSGYSNAVAAAEGNEKIHIVDSKTISLGIALMARKAVSLVNEGKLSGAEIAAEVASFREHVEASLLIDKLDFMYKGGRCSKLSLIGANLLKIKPAIVAEDDGKLTVGKKFRGKLEKTVADYLNATLDAYEGIDWSYAALGYTALPGSALSMAVSLLKDRGFKEVYVTETNATDACHGGPNVIGFAFAFENRKKVSILPFGNR